MPGTRTPTYLGNNPNQLISSYRYLPMQSQSDDSTLGASRIQRSEVEEWEEEEADVELERELGQGPPAAHEDWADD